MKSPWRKRAKHSVNNFFFGKPANKSREIYLMLILFILAFGLLI